MNKFAPTPEEIEEICKLYQEGYSFKSLGQLYNTSYSTIDRLLKKHKVPIRSAYNDRHPNKKPKYKSPYSRGMNPNSHGGASRRKQSARYMHDLGKYRYKTRLYPSRCMFIKRRNDEQCQNYCTPGAKTCYYHGGRLYQLKIKTGTHSKILKRNIMHYLTQISAEESKAIQSNDYSKLTILDHQNKLSDILLARALKFLNESEIKLNDITQEIIDLKNGTPASQGMTGLLITQAALLKNITTTHGVIQKHQEQISKNLITQEQIIGSRDITDNLNDLTISINKDSVGILTDLIQSYISAGAIENIDEIKKLLPQQPQYVPVQYELLDD